MTHAKRPVLHLICQAHIDPVWLWPRRDGFAEVLTTLQSAVDRLHEDRALRFSQCSMAFYRVVEERDPRLFSEIRSLISAGRWEVIGPWEVQPDCNYPSAESFLRHAEYGARYARESLGTVPRILWNPDSFGHAAGLPTLMRKSGIDRYVMMRPHDAEATRPLPKLFWWAGADGSRVLTWRIPTSYAQSPDCTAAGLQDWIRRTWREHIPEGLSHGCCFIGVGNHGGGPTRVHLQALRDMRDEADLPELRFSTLAEFFAAVEGEAGIAIVTGELQRHAPGCYALHAGMKQAYRAAESALLRAEAIGSVMGESVDLEPPWRRLLFNQFHDILGGSCVRSACAEALADLGGVRSEAESRCESMVARIARRIDTRGAPAGVLTVVNPLPWPRVATTVFDAFRDPAQAGEIRSWVGPDGTALPVQWLEGDAHYGPFGLPWGKMVTAIPVGATGWESGLLGSADPGRLRTPAPIRPLAGAFGLYPEHWSGPMTIRVLADDGDTWAHGVSTWDRELEPVVPSGHRIVARGPVVAVTRITGVFRRSRVIVEGWRWSHDPQTIDLRVAWEGRDPRIAVAVEIPTDGLEDVRCSVAGAIIERQADGCMASHQDWLSHGQFSVFPEACAAHDARPGRLRLFIVRTAMFAEHAPFVAQVDDGHDEHIDSGWTHHRLLVHRGVLSDDQRCRRAAEVRFASEYFPDSAHPGDLPRRAAAAEMEPGLALWARRGGSVRGLELATGAVAERRLR